MPPLDGYPGPNEDQELGLGPPPCRGEGDSQSWETLRAGYCVIIITLKHQVQLALAAPESSQWMDL